MPVFALDHTICPQKENFQASNYVLQHPRCYHSHYVAGREVLLKYRDYYSQICSVLWGLDRWWLYREADIWDSLTCQAERQVQDVPNFEPQ